ncbi:hypothetical protein V6N13_073042 [Hibiscus sabdariffa]|uniref:Uncharacterized protein n=1 Tax=Hibiscus sabdariffa TaxID=183260 RepID=A0ABR2E7Z7_9ROSI
MRGLFGRVWEFLLSPRSPQPPCVPPLAIVKLPPPPRGSGNRNRQRVKPLCWVGQADRLGEPNVVNQQLDPDLTLHQAQFKPVSEPSGVEP